MYRFNEIAIKIPIAFITEIEKKKPKIRMEAQKTLNIQSNSEQKLQCWRYHNTRLQIMLESVTKTHSNGTNTDT
jgi:hypothetical protein